jgi:hypothetical protein
MNTATARHPFDDVEIIASYSRAQAIEDGVLVDLRQGEFSALVDEAGFRFPVAATAAVWTSCIDLTPSAARAGCDVKGRLWDVLMAMKHAVRLASRDTDTVFFRLSVVRDSRRPTVTILKAVIGPGDEAEPVITIMMPEED